MVSDRHLEDHRSCRMGNDRHEPVQPIKGKEFPQYCAFESPQIATGVLEIDAEDGSPRPTRYL